LTGDPTFHDVPVPLDKTEQLLKSVSQLQAEIKNCWRTLEQAKLKRREISSNAELIHGECDSQLAGEQRLTVFVKSINSILRYFEDVDRMTVDFMSPLFNSSK
jgi:hypothetical protein